MYWVGFMVFNATFNNISGTVKPTHNVTCINRWPLNTGLTVYRGVLYIGWEDGGLWDVQLANIVTMLIFNCYV